MISRDYQPVEPDSRMEDDLRQLTRLAIREDLERQIDWTTVALIPEDSRGECSIVSRESGVCAGLAVVPWILDEADAELSAVYHVTDGSRLSAGTRLATLSGNCRDLLTTERIVLNFLCRLCGIATLTARYREAIAGTNARLYDTRKTTPGWRRLEKYATRCGGAHNHRTGLFDGFLVKDNHLALGGTDGKPLRPAQAIQTISNWRGAMADNLTAPAILELEVDSIDQLRDALSKQPDIVLLDNFSLESLRAAVELRDRMNPQVQLEASGGVNLDTIGAIATTGVERISTGAITHAARWLDLGLDWV